MPKDSHTSEINELKKKMEENPDSLVFALLADAYRKEGDLVQAQEICQKGLQKHPNHTIAKIVLGRIFQGQNKVDDASLEYKQVLEADPENIMAHSLLGSLHVQKKEYQEAIEEFQKVLTLNPDDEEAPIALKEAIERAAIEQQNNIKTSNKEAAQTNVKNPTKESNATITLAELYIKQNHFDKAIEVFQELLANDPQNLMLRQKLSDAVERHQKDSAVGPIVTKLKKNEFTQPPDHKEDVLVEEQKSETKKYPKKKEDDSKFTNEDILQVMRRGGKDDIMEEEKTIPSMKKKDDLMPVSQEGAEKNTNPKWNAKNNVELKSILGELGSVDGIIDCFLIDLNGNLVVSTDESGNNAVLGKQINTIFDSITKSVNKLNQGNSQQILITSDSGHIQLVSFPELILIVLTNNKINLGFLRLTLDSVRKKMEKVIK